MGLGPLDRSRYALVAVWAAMALTYYIVKPEAFGRASTFQSIFGGQEQQLYIFLALAALSTLIVGEFDLSVASVMGLAATIIPVLNAQHHVNIVLSCIVGVAAATACGAVNAFFIVGLAVPSLVVTLGSGTLFIGLAELLSGTGAISIRPSSAFADLTQYDILGCRSCSGTAWPSSSSSPTSARPPRSGGT